MINRPTKSTLDRYGLTLAEWIAFIPVPDGVVRTEENVLEHGFCPICEKPPATGRMVVDHRHVTGWKKMPPEERKEYVRGVVCTTCNHFILTRYGSALKHTNTAAYLIRYESRKKVF